MHLRLASKNGIILQPAPIPATPTKPGRRKTEKRPEKVTLFSLLMASPVDVLFELIVYCLSISRARSDLGFAKDEPINIFKGLQKSRAISAAQIPKLNMKLRSDASVEYFHRNASKICETSPLTKEYILERKDPLILVLPASDLLFGIDPKKLRMCSFVLTAIGQKLAKDKLHERFKPYIDSRYYDTMRYRVRRYFDV